MKPSATRSADFFGGSLDASPPSFGSRVPGEGVTGGGVLDRAEIGVPGGGGVTVWVGWALGIDPATGAGCVTGGALGGVGICAGGVGGCAGSCGCIRILFSIAVFAYVRDIVTVHKSRNSTRVSF